MENCDKHRALDGKKNEFRAEDFVQMLLNETANIPCDDSWANYINNNLPPYYDEKKCKRGHAFFHTHIFGHFFGAILGLTTVLAIQSILKIVMLTKMSGCSMTAYRRYTATVFHMLTWYDSDFTPGSRLWRSVLDVKAMHNSSSKKSHSSDMHRINQKDVALGQFGFVVYAVIRGKYVGIHNATDEQLHDFIHLWRVLGHLLRLDDKYNICRGSVEETKQICESIFALLKPALEEKGEDFMNMSRYMLEGTWSINQLLSHKAILCYVYKLMTVNENSQDNTNMKSFIKMHLGERIIFNLYSIIAYLLQYTPYRVMMNYLQYFTIWLMQHFPLFAYVKYGYQNSHVTILNLSKKD